MSWNVGQALYQNARLEPSHVALREIDGQQRTFSYGELHGLASRAAAALQKLTLAKKARILICAENGADWVATWFGTQYLGCIVFPTSPLLSASELGERIRRSRCELILCDSARTGLVESALSSLGKFVPSVVLPELFDEKISDMAPLQFGDESVSAVFFTSGTEGVSKGAMITHRSLCQHTQTLANTILNLRASDRVLGVLPLSHSYGLRMTLLAPFFAGAQTFLAGRFHALPSLHALRDCEITWVGVVPTMLAAWSQHDAISAPTLRWCLSAGAPLADDLCLKAEKVLGTEVRQGFGLSEATFCTINAPDDERMLGSVGKVVPGVEIRIVDGSGRDQLPGQAGEVQIRGANVMLGYLDDQESTNAVFQKGWLRTGDIGMLDEHEHLHIVDRIKDLIIRGGYNVYPSELENNLRAYKDIRDLCVVGIDDKFYGEEIALLVVPKDPHADSLRNLQVWLTKNISAPARPHYAALMDSFPTGSGGKISRHEARARIADGTISLVNLRTLS